MAAAHSTYPDLDPRKLSGFEPCPTTGCHLWTGAQNVFGYGIVYDRNRRNIGTHRAAWFFAHGPIPGGLYVLHRCDNPFCINPAHLFLGTHADNHRDMWRKGRGKTPAPRFGDQHHCGKRTHCPQGHPYSDENTYRGQSYGRLCKICSQVHSKLSKQRARARKKESIREVY